VSEEDRDPNRGRRSHGDDRDIDIPPDGATCSEHPERAALAVCPRCGEYACLACWHHPIRRCHRCLMLDPAGAAPPIAWEQRDRNVVARFFATLATALQPLASAPAFARSGVGPAIRFWLVTFVPLALLSRIIDFTRLHYFVDRLILVVGTPSDAETAVDVGRAIALGALVSVVAVLALALPYVSLIRSYSARGSRLDAPVRLLLYRSFLVPLASVINGVGIWLLPVDPDVAAFTLVQIAAVIPLVLLFSAMRATARMATGLGPVLSLATAIVPLMVMLIGQQFLIDALTPVPTVDHEAVRAMVVAARGETP
jgi:hypothetical protein